MISSVLSIHWRDSWSEALQLLCQMVMQLLSKISLFPQYKAVWCSSQSVEEGLAVPSFFGGVMVLSRSGNLI